MASSASHFQGVNTPDPYNGTVDEPAVARDAESSLKSGIQAQALSGQGLLEHKTAAGGQGFDRESFTSMSKAPHDISKTSFTLNPIFTGADAPYTHDLTLRSLLVGAILGVIFGTQNVYFGIRSGVSFGGSITVSLLGFGIMKILTKFIGRSLPFNAHENVILQTTAATGQSMIFTGGYSTYILAMSTDVAGPNELAPEETYDINYWRGLLWLLSVICLGFFMAQPMRQQLIVKNDYPWPSPTATAVVIQSLHQAGAQEFAMKMLKFLLKVAGGSFVWYWFKWLFNADGNMEGWPIFGATAAAFNWTLDWSTAYIGSGVLMPWKSAWSMLAGTIVMFGIVSPVVWEYQSEWFPDQGKSKGSFQGLKSYWFLPALAITVVDSVYQILKILGDFALSKRAGAASTSYVSGTELGRKVEDPKTLIPTWLWAGGFVANTVLVCITTPLLFDVKWYQCLVCVMIGPIIGYGVNLGAALTDVGLVSALGKFIIICLGGWAGSVNSALWLAGLGMAAVGSSNDLLGDYRTAYLLGTSPRSMFKAQVFGAVFAAFFTPATYLLFLGAFEISTDGIFQAPGAVALRALAVLFVEGLSILPVHVGAFVIAFSVWTVVNNLMNDFLPEKYSRFLPNSIAFAVGGYVAPSYGINPVIGYGIKWIWGKSNPAAAEAFAPALGGGLIAGEGIAATTSAIFALAKINQPAGMSIHFGPSA